MPTPTYIISKVADPIFAVVIGLSAATTRINREEKEKGVPTSETVAAGKRYVSHFIAQPPTLVFSDALLYRSHLTCFLYRRLITLSERILPGSNS